MYEASVNSIPYLSESDIAFESLTRASWFAVYTKSRHEKILRDELSKKRIETFLPVRKVERHWSDRTKVIEEPLFQSYLFVKILWADRWKVLNTVGAVSIVGMSQGKAIEVPQKEIETLQQFVSQDIRINPFPYLKTGERVYVRSGPFKGAEGFIVHKNQRCRLVVSLDLLMQSISIEIDSACIERVGSESKPLSGFHVSATN